ncbi:carbohydrate ABC transporter permease [Microbacterium halophytorum]|uniref:carbohydrate ABC transporter permease n=1 Tax=Microbacterium halophytorum TaxID=2067568 RepID=UPI000CFB4786|nr:sugar ABC transporter permease [Microbacterium halophytorum]
MKRSLGRWGWLFAGPTLAAFLIGFVVPFVLGVYLSFTEFRTVTKAEWVGVENYAKLLGDEVFLHSLWYTTAFVIVTTVLVNVIAFAIAYLLVKSFRGRNIFRSVFFMPNLIGGIVLGYIWLLLLNGVLAHWARSITYSETYGFWGLVLLMCWQQIGYMMVIYIAGIQSVPGEMFEAAQIDGAGRWRTLRSVVIPLVTPAITVCTFLTLTNGFKVFDQNLALTNGAPSQMSEMLALNIFNTFYGRTGFEGVGQAKAVVFLIILAVVALLQNRYARSKETVA